MLISSIWLTNVTSYVNLKIYFPIANDTIIILNGFMFMYPDRYASVTFCDWTHAKFQGVACLVE